jgi:hypothetical protein
MGVDDVALDIGAQEPERVGRNRRQANMHQNAEHKKFGEQIADADSAKPRHRARMPAQSRRGC